jgi:TPR repeat protein
MHSYAVDSHDAPRGWRKAVVIAAASVVVSAIWLSGRPAMAMSGQMTERAGELYGKGDWHALAALTKQATNEDSSDGVAWYYAGRAQDGLGNKAAATADYEKAYRYGPPYLRQSLEMVLAGEYAALGDRAKLIAVYRELQKDNPSYAMSMRSQYAQLLGSVAKLPPVATPDISPETLSALTAHVRQTWRSDAIPVMVEVTYQGGALRDYMVEVDYYSPSTGTGLMAIHGPNGATMDRVAHPRWGTVAVPDSFGPLKAAVSYARKGGLSGRLGQAFLYRTSDTPDPTNLVWDLAFGKNDTDIARIVAYVMPKAEFDHLVSSASGGDKSAQYELANVYATGVAGMVDARVSVSWLKKAATQGSGRAENKLGQFYQRGFGVTANPKRAAYWYWKAASAGYGPAQFNLALLYEDGLGVRQDWITAEKWLILAAKQGMQNAYAELAIVRHPAEHEARERELAAEQRAASRITCGVGFAPFKSWNRVQGWHVTSCMPSGMLLGHMMTGD